jgi:hypothetical protein
LRFSNRWRRFVTYQELVVEADQEIQRQLGNLDTAATAERTISKRTKASAYQRRRYEPKTFDLRSELYRVFGVDLTNVPGISAITAQTILCEIGTDVSRFRNASAFASWLGLCPENKISGGKVLYNKSRRVRSRVATALRMAAPRQRLSWRVLSAHHAEARQTPSNYGHGAQTSVVRHTDGLLFRLALARLTFSRMSLALAVQMKGFGSRLCCST